MNYKSKDRYWLEVFEDYNQSGLSQKHYCKVKNLTHTQFKYYWEKLVLRNRPPTSRSQSNVNNFESIIVDTEATAELPVETTKMLVTLPNQIRCEFTVNTLTNQLTGLLKQLATLC